MIVQKCSLCHDVQSEPLTWTVIAWYDQDGSRRSFKHKLCLECVATLIAPVHVACEQPAMLCPNCGIETSDNYDAVYGTFIPKRIGALRFEAPFCPPCAQNFRERFKEGALELPDRDPREIRENKYVSAEPSAVWAALGVTPRAR